ncbi:hypothetical protein DFP72DRAFT_861967 [Ephemerocybe angulata]|uniref:Uncharacterized protein n=1 Tax=Ephemerocybe angulata TaxID=980116 RepID=A0A8H6H8R6_9AGAR|nr:hypothetical protein DFP72DRAFT_861967 [Tulosesus angulatus]
MWIPRESERDQISGWLSFVELAAVGLTKTSGIVESGPGMRLTVSASLPVALRLYANLNYLLDHDDDNDAFQRDFSIEAANLSRRNLLVGRLGTKAASRTAGSQRQVARAHWRRECENTVNSEFPSPGVPVCRSHVRRRHLHGVGHGFSLVGSRRLQEGPGSGGVLLDVVGTSRKGQRVREYGWKRYSKVRERSLARLVKHKIDSEPCFTTCSRRVA